MSKLSGFSLIELLVVIAILGLLTGGSVAGFNTLQKKETVRSQAKELMSNLRQAQTKASAGVKPTGCVSLNGYLVAGAANASVYTVSAACTNQTYEIKKVRMNEGVTLAQAMSLTFVPLTGGVQGTVGDIGVKTSVYTFIFTINQAGDLSEKGLQ